MVQHKTAPMVYPSQPILPEAPRISGTTNHQSNQPLQARNQRAVSRNASRRYNITSTSAEKKPRVSALSPTGKQWHPNFYSYRICGDRPVCTYPNDNQSVDDVAACNETPSAQINITNDPFDDQVLLETFLEDFEGSIPSWEAKVIRRFLAEHSNRSSGPQQLESWAWMDDREHTSGRSRAYPQGLDANKLRVALIEKVSCMTITLVNSCSDF